MVLFQVVDNAWDGPARWWNFCDSASTLERLQFESTVTKRRITRERDFFLMIDTSLFVEANDTPISDLG